MGNDNDDLRKNLFIIVPFDLFNSVFNGNSAILPDENIHHIRKVLRNSGSIPVNIACGDGRVLPSTLDSTNTLTKRDSHYNLQTYLKVSLITPGIKRKNLELQIKKLTEIGVYSINFITSEYQNFPPEKSDRYEKLIFSACEQAKNPLKPQIINSKYNILNYPFTKDILYLWGDPSSDWSLKNILELDLQEFSEICYINGPEGGWSPEEEKFLKNRFRSIRLSQNVLRSETAAITAIFGIKLLTGL